MCSKAHTAASISSELLALREAAMDVGAHELAYLIDVARLQALLESGSTADPAPMVFHISDMVPRS